MVDDEDEPGDVVDMSQWSDAEWHRAVALAAYTLDIEDDEAHELAPNYDW